tara:strand:+ start:2001 stop:4160 length:2160 start_codon:yes stop_codon:yes gene_type:complete
MYKYKKKIVFFLFIFTCVFAENSSKIGLVLSGGGSKGFAHIATLKALDSLKIPIDYIAGTSFGAIVGAMYALGYSGKQIETMARNTNWYEVQKDKPERKYLPHFRKKDTGKYQLEFGLDRFKPVPPTGLIYGQKIILELSKWTREFEQIYDFDQFPIPFRCNAFDIISGKEVILKEGSLSHALRASLSIPTIFAPVERGDALLVDGGVINNLPVDIVKDMGADIVLAIDVSNTIQSKSSLTNVFDVIDQAITVHGYGKKIENIQATDFYIHPNVDDIRFTDYRLNSMQSLFDRGEEAVLANWEMFLELKKITSNRSQNHKHIEPLQKPLINDIYIRGNNSLNKNFIYSFIGLQTGMQLDTKILDENIAELYSLGYFKILYYEIHTLKSNTIDIIIHLEETELRKFQLGMRWDNYYNLVGAINVQLTSNLLPGLRIENQVQFGGDIKKNEFTISYPSRSLNFPIFPYFQMVNSISPYEHFSNNKFEGIYNYSLIENKLGLGVFLKNYWHAEYEYFSKESGIKTEQNLSTNISKSNKLVGLRTLVQLDVLDNVLLPKDGIFIQALYEDSKIDLGSDYNYQYYKAIAKLYKTFHLNTYGISGYYHYATDHTPIYMTTIFEGSQTFAGAKEFQLHGSSLTFFQLDYKYRQDKDVYFHFIANWIMNANSESGDIMVENIWGFGAGITLVSPFGPLEFIWSIGPENIYSNSNQQHHFHFSAGYNF